MSNTKINLCQNLQHRSVDNYILTCRHNRREDGFLEKKFSLYEREMRLLDHAIHVAEHRCEQHARDSLGLVISYRHKPLEASGTHRFYYPSTSKNSTTKVYSVTPLFNVLQHQNLYEYAFQSRSRQYRDELKQKTQSQKIRKEQLMNQTIPLIRDDYQRNTDWPLSEYARIKLPSIYQTKSNYLSKRHFPTEI